MSNPAGPVRAEDAFDVEAVREWLRAQGAAIGTPVRVRQFGGGASNLTYELTSPDRQWILRRPPGGRKAEGAHDMAREYRVQAALAEPYGLVPRMVALCTDESVIGSQFYVMERVPGHIPRRDLGLDLTVQQTRELCTNALDALIALHRIEPTGDLAALGKGTGYVARQVAGWSARYLAAHTADAPDLGDVLDWLAANQPADVATCVIHNDFRFDNLVLATDDPTRLVAVLDWEMATLGDPLMDLGGTLAYWVQPDDDEFFQQFRRQPTTDPGMLTREQVVAYYCERMGFEVTADRWRFYEVFGLIRLAVIAQQIHYRYFHGQTTNPAYRAFGPAVHYLGSRCRSILAEVA